MGSGDHSSLGPETLGRLLPLPSTSCWWLPASGHQGLGSLSNCQPHAIGTSRWAFPIPPPHGSYWGALPGPGSGSGRGWGSADQVDPPVQHLHVSTAPPMVAAKTQGPGRKLCPKSPRKYQHQSLGRWNLITKPVMAQPAPDLPPPWQTGWGQQVALCCLQSLGTAGALSDLQITLSPVHSTQQSLSQQASDYKLNRHALVHLQCG